MTVFQLFTLCFLSIFFCTGVFAADISVKDFGAVGDGKADDTAAIRAALDKAAETDRGASVVLPAGEYRVTGTLNVNGCLLKGLDAGAWSSDRATMPTLLVDHTNDPCINAGHAASVHGINFEYDHKGQEARKFGPAILLSGIGVSLTNLRISQPYEAIMADGKTNIGRLNIENVFIISARSCGVYVTNTYDIATLRNIEVWNPNTYAQKNCTGFKFGKNDEIRIDNCFAFACRTGFLFVKEKDGPTWGGMTGCSVDFSVLGIVIEEVDSLRITSGCLWAHSTSLKTTGPGRIMVSGVDLRSNGDAALIVDDCTSLTLTGCNLGKSGPDWPAVPAAKLNGGRSVLLNGNTFDDNGPGVFIGEKARYFSITNNIFQRSQFDAITDKSPSNAQKLISGNLTEKISKSADP
ncbi:MAG: hypothetical protein GX139_00150 [Armatimonadetes bacterium]|jgi:hypothetical protein|nr:hypothetical protein [Armatimonadota bacterium]